ncbi:hypothetical protein KU6B_31120 [Mameliella alba]|uniref:Lin0512 family protein n=1 Tax=Mameliella alba TaxID=561184 RepID=UPI0013E50BA7|nr:Lin0512 family protein [Mameliella alba]BBU56847.1 hypothetical protein KU6B_31120 [Mameliella alba]
MRQRLIVQMGMGVGETAGLAAERAIASAQARAVLHVDVDCAVHVTLGVPESAELDTSGVNRAFGAAEVEVRVVPGGMSVPQPGGAALVMVSAAIEVFPLGPAA